MQIKLHLGCGHRNFGSDWVHVDGGDYDHLDYHDITKLPYEDSSVDQIYASHVLEYFNKQDVHIVLSEWYRVLKPAGEIRIAVPDFQTMTRLYHEGRINLDDILGPIFGKMLMADETIYHRMTYDQQSLTDLMKTIGFIDIKKYDWRKYQIHKDNDDHSQSYLCPTGDKKNGTLISLNLCATK